jgi:hypothetical protein
MENFLKIFHLKLALETTITEFINDIDKLLQSSSNMDGTSKVEKELFISQFAEKFTKGK